MEHFFLDQFQTHFAAFEHWGYFVIFLVAFVESIPLLGMLIPGQIVIILAGFFVKLGIFSFPAALAVASFGAVLGDMAGFAIGKRYRDKLPNWVNAFLKKEHLDKTQALIEKHSIKTIFVGRLHSLTRTITPFAAGTTSVTFRKFIAADIFSAIIWAFLSITIGFVFGKSFELAAAFIGKFILVATLITIVLIFIVKLLREHSHRISWTDFSLYGACAAFAYLFAITAQDVATGRLFHILDIRTAAIISHIHTPFLDWLMTTLTILGNPFYITSLASLLCLWLLARKRYQSALLCAITMSSSIILLNILKASFDKVRPNGGLIETFGSSFPSGHAMMSVVLASLLSYTIIRHIKSDVRKNALYFSVFMLAVCIGFSRVYLNVHWASDVLAGFFVGAFFATLMISLGRLVLWMIKRSKRNRNIINIP